jgi:AAA+ ATPase superfamily predicted ATPase
MSSRFIGRQRELAALEAAFAADRSGLIPVYGRRRVGKSTLLLRMLESHPGIFYLGKQAPAELQLAEFLAAASRALDQPLLERLRVEGWKQALETVLDAWRGPGKLVIVLDEFQWIVSASPELPSVLQELWDRRLASSNEALLILCGSYVGFMEREVLGNKSPLFGRRTAQIHLQPFGFREARQFHPGYSLTEAARAYFICGGVPLYLLAFDPARSVEQNIEAQLLDEFAPLFREPDFLLREELRELSSYHAILTTLASGSLPAREVSRRTGIESRNLNYYLNQLVELRYLRRRYPLTGAPPAAKQVRFVLEDPLLRFWFRFVFPNTSALMQMGPRRCFEQRVRPELEPWFGLCFEALCREALPALYEQEGVNAGFEVGEYWDKAVQIDVVGLRDDGWTDIGECKWGKVPSKAALEAEVRRKAQRFDNRRGATLAHRLFVRDARELPDALPGAPRWHGLADLYGES